MHADLKRRACRYNSSNYIEELIKKMALPVFALLTSVAWLVPVPAPARAPPPRASLGDGAAHSGVAAFAAAFGASVIATVALHPVDTLKTRQQHAVTSPDASIWRGVSANVLKEAPDAAVFLALTETLSQSLAYHSPWFASHITMTLLLAGAIGDAVGSIFRLPAEVLCKRLQTDSAVGWDEALSGTSRAHWLHAWEAILFRDVSAARSPHL